MFTDEYTSELPVLRAQLETDRTLLSELEPSLNSTILELLAAKALLPNISLLNNQTTQLRRTRLYESKYFGSDSFLFYDNSSYGTEHINNWN